MTTPSDADLCSVITGALDHCHAAAAEHGCILSGAEVALIRTAAARAAELTSDLLLRVVEQSVIAAVIEHAMKTGRSGTTT